MLDRIAADALVLFHFGFVVFVLLGGLLVLRWPRLLWLHLPCVAWGAWVELAGRICPLTPLENRLRIAADGEGYSGGFIEHYLAPLIYPPGLTRELQIGVGLMVLALNLAAYGVLLWRVRKST